MQAINAVHQLPSPVLQTTSQQPPERAPGRMAIHRDAYARSAPVPSLGGHNEAPRTLPLPLRTPVRVDSMPSVAQVPPSLESLASPKGAPSPQPVPTLPARQKSQKSQASQALQTPRSTPAAQRPAASFAAGSRSPEGQPVAVSSALEPHAAAPSGAPFVVQAETAALLTHAAQFLGELIEFVDSKARDQARPTLVSRPSWSWVFDHSCDPRELERMHTFFKQSLGLVWGVKLLRVEQTSYRMGQDSDPLRHQREFVKRSSQGHRSQASYGHSRNISGDSAERSMSAQRSPRSSKSSITSLMSRFTPHATLGRMKSFDSAQSSAAEVISTALPSNVSSDSHSSGSDLSRYPLDMLQAGGLRSLLGCVEQFVHYEPASDEQSQAVEAVLYAATALSAQLEGQYISLAAKLASIGRAL